MQTAATTPLVTFMTQPPATIVCATAFPIGLPRPEASIGRTTIGTLIRGGTVVTATHILQADFLMEEGAIAELGSAIDASPHTTVDATGCYVFPGGIGPHTHLDRPFGGTVTADDFATGTVAAALGGTASIVDFALYTEGRLVGQRACNMEENGRRQGGSRLYPPSHDRRRQARNGR